jgi:hypothetical protein
VGDLEDPVSGSYSVIVLTDIKCRTFRYFYSISQRNITTMQKIFKDFGADLLHQWWYFCWFCHYVLGLIIRGKNIYNHW